MPRSTKRSQRRGGRWRGGRSWWQVPPGASLCAIVGMGTPMDASLFGGHLLNDIGPVALGVGLFAGATVWMFRRWGDGATQETPAVAADSHELWAELEALGYEPRDDSEPVDV